MKRFATRIVGLVSNWRECRTCRYCGYSGSGWPDSGECPNCGEVN